MQVDVKSMDVKPSEEQLSEVAKVVSTLKAEKEQKKIDEPNKPFNGWSYIAIEAGANRTVIIDIVKKLAASAGREKEILFAPSKQNDTGMVVLSRTNESMQAGLISIQSALMQLRTIVYEDDIQKGVKKPARAFDGYEVLARLDIKYATLKANAENGLIAQPAPRESHEDVKKVSAKKEKLARPARVIKITSVDVRIVQGISVNCRNKYSGGDSINLELPANVIAGNAARSFNLVVKDLKIDGVKCEKTQDSVNGITITASNAELLERTLSKLGVYSPILPQRGGLS